MILEKFFTDKYDDWTVFVNPDMKFGEFKRYVAGQTKEFEKSEKENVVLLCENYFDFAVNFFAAVFARKNIHLLTDRTRLSLLDFEYILPGAPEDIVEENLDISGNKPLLEIKDFGPPARGGQRVEGETLPKMNKDSFISHFDAAKIQVNLFTSGSTGVPKNIMKTLYNFEAEAQSVIDEFKLQDDYIIASTTSSAHSFGMAFNFIVPFLGGFKINRKKVEFPEHLNIKDKYILISTPSFMEKLAKYDFEFEYSPEKIFLAGAKMKPELYDYYSRFTEVIDIYGSTETGDIGWKQGGDIFNVFDAVEVDVADDGRIIVKSEFFPSGEIVLNDLIEKLSENNFILKKRSDRIVKIQEKRISLDEMENNLKKHKSVKDCRCFVYDDKFCCAVVTDDVEIQSSDLRHFLLQFSEIVPKKWRILDEIPKNMSGKIDTMKLRKLFGVNLSYPFIFSRQTDASQADLELLFRKNSNFFNGHFDGMPVLPGVVQLYYAKFFAEDIFGLQLPHNEFKRVKFSNIMQPDTRFRLKLLNKEKSVEFTYMADDKVYSSGIFVK